MGEKQQRFCRVVAGIGGGEAARSQSKVDDDSDRVTACRSATWKRGGIEAVLHNFTGSTLNSAGGPLVECDTAAIAAPHFGLMLFLELGMIATLTFGIQIDEVRHGNGFH